MDAEAEQLLRDRLTAAGAYGGGKGAGYRGARGGALGARFAARLLPIRTHEETAELEQDPGEAAEVLSDVIEHYGRVVSGEIVPGGRRATLRGLIGSGGLNMNPAVVDVELERRAGGGSLATVRTAAKEGLIRQHSASKAARQVLESYGVATRAPAES